MITDQGLKLALETAFSEPIENLVGGACRSLDDRVTVAFSLYEIAKAIRYLADAIRTNKV